jgi:hypothetical protein
MLHFLKTHFRYYTAHSWNRATSYARKIKIHQLGLDRETENKCYDMLEISEAFEDFTSILRDFALRHDFAWQIAQNGRSGGYLALYQGGRKDSGYKTRCNTCFIPTWYAGKQPCHRAECDGVLEPLSKPLWETYVHSGRGVDDDGDYDSISYEELRERVVLVSDFDRTCQLAIEAFVNYAKIHEVQEKEIMVPKTVKVAVEI